MKKVIEGKLDATNMKFALVISRFNNFITERLLDGAVDALVRHGANSENLVVFRVPGAWEMPVITKKIANRGEYNAIICLGAVIRGGTPHFDYVAAEVSKGIAQVSLQTETPIAFGVLTTDNIEQAIERAGTKAGNKGWEAAMAAIEMANLITQL